MLSASAALRPLSKRSVIRAVVGSVSPRTTARTDGRCAVPSEVWRTQNRAGRRRLLSSSSRGGGTGGFGGGRGGRGEGGGGGGRHGRPPPGSNPLGVDRGRGGRRAGGGGRREDNFDRRVLQPASRGELVDKHSSGIPRLAGRSKHKPRLYPEDGGRGGGGGFGYRPRALFSPDDDSDGWDEEEEEDAPSFERMWLKSRSPTADRISSSSSRDGGVRGVEDVVSDFFGSEDYDEESDDDEDNAGDAYVDDDDPVWREMMENPEMVKALFDASDVFRDENVDPYYAPELFDDDRYYWREEEFEEREEVASYDVSGGDDEEEVGAEEDHDGGDGGERRRAVEDGGGGDPLADWQSRNDIVQIAENMDEKDFGDEPEGEIDVVLPLRDYGPDVDDFVAAMADHPTSLARVSRHNLHPDSLREPKPEFPKKSHRANPPLEFVSKHARFLYVTGLPPFLLDGRPYDGDNPVHRDLLQKDLARVAGVDDPSRVYPANAASGFVGFSSPRELSQALSRGPAETVLKRPASISRYQRPSEGDGDGDGPFPDDSSDAIVRVTDLPSGNTSASLARDLFPDGTEVGAVYGGLSPDDVHFESSTTALIRFRSAEQAASALESDRVRDRLREFGVYNVSFFRARRELLHAGFGGPGAARELRKMGPRLVVDGDMPSRKFYISHAGTIFVRNLDPALTKREISARFQPYCAQRRDIEGSIEFVTCTAGEHTGLAYVGFDLPGEAEDALRQACAGRGGRMMLGDRAAVLKLVRDRRIPGKTVVRPEKRPERPLEELLDDLNNWRKFVDPADLEVLKEGGVSMSALDDALRGIRYDNPTFGTLDASLRSEALRPDKGRGELYGELVRMYVDTLKECLATPEDVGEMYEAMHFPDEPIDLSVFDREKERQAKLEEKRASRS